MYRTFLMLALGFAACRDNNSGTIPPADLSHTTPTDAAADLTMLNYTTAVPHDIDTAASGSALGNNALVRLTNMVVVTPTSKFFSRSSTTCKYEVWVQDPTCTTPPCGIAVVVNGMNLGIQDAGSSSCPLPQDSMSLLASVHIGDTIDLTGKVDVFTDNGAAHVKEHQVIADSITPSGTPATITATEITDGSIFVTSTGTGWAMYEGMYVKIHPNSNLTVSSVDSMTPYHFHTMPGNTDWGTSFRFAYKWDGGDYPSMGNSFVSISGVVTNAFGGAVEPTKLADFVVP